MAQTQNPWYVLAHILALLSGTWIIGSGMYMNVVSNSIFAHQNYLEYPLKVANSNNENVTVELEGVMNEARELSGQMIDLSINSARSATRLFYLGSFFAVSSLVAWFWGWWTGRSKRKNS